MKDFFLTIFSWWVFWWSKGPILHTLFTILFIAFLIAAFVFWVLGYSLQV